ncbi:hypothetical protein [Polynucleobacter asymbioticus]|uniref:hypothetical protein n=1 Tax=Polynucleobacter asymbioticus TaxID=576611 RepID=UPI0008F81E2B|nr:hypothetical protein [Polynucleobacter asymbioticus]
MKKILIITSTISPIADDIKHVNVMARKLESIEAIKFYLSLDIFDKIIFSDNSGVSLLGALRDESINVDSIYNELIFKLDESFYERYSGLKYMGEIETIDKVLNNFAFSNEDEIYKVTGRYIINNISYFINNSNYSSNIFISYYPILFNKKSLYTSFYKVNRDLLVDIVSNVKFLYEHGYVKPIEYAFGLHLSKFKFINKNSKIRRLPQIIGISGTNGKKINNNDIRMKITDLFMRAFGLAFTYKK